MLRGVQTTWQLSKMRRDIHEKKSRKETWISMKRDLDMYEKRRVYVAGCADYMATIQGAHLRSISCIYE